MTQFRHLILHHFCNSGMRVSTIDSRYACTHIEILAPLMVEQVLAMAFRDEQWFFVVECLELRHMFFPLIEDIFKLPPSILLRPV